MYIGVLGEYVYTLSLYLEKTHISFLLIRRLRRNPFHVLREYADILSAY